MWRTEVLTKTTNKSILIDARRTMATLINCPLLTVKTGSYILDISLFLSLHLSFHSFSNAFWKVPILTIHLLTHCTRTILTYLFSPLAASKICLAQREYDTVRIGLPPNKISYYVEINYYPDKELLVKTQTGCLRACSMENEFICRSILYRANYKPGQPSKQFGHN